MKHGTHDWSTAQIVSSDPDRAPVAKLAFVSLCLPNVMRGFSLIERLGASSTGVGFLNRSSFKMAPFSERERRNCIKRTPFSSSRAPFSSSRTPFSSSRTPYLFFSDSLSFLLGHHVVVRLLAVTTNSDLRCTISPSLLPLLVAQCALIWFEIGFFQGLTNLPDFPHNPHLIARSNQMVARAEAVPSSRPPDL